jgi:hypothetical protein
MFSAPAWKWLDKGEVAVGEERAKGKRIGISAEAQASQMLPDSTLGPTRKRSDSGRLAAPSARA